MQSEIQCTETIAENGDIEINFKCSKCGGIVKMRNPEFGFDCENGCIEAEYRRAFGIEAKGDDK